MSNERANEFLSWRGRLTPPDALPEQGLEDKELTWQRLAERLEKKPARRGIVWWIAAACLLMALLPATLFFRTRPAHPTRLAARTTHPHIPTPTHTPAPAHTPIATTTPHTPSPARKTAATTAPTPAIIAATPPLHDTATIKIASINPTQSLAISTNPPALAPAPAPAALAVTTTPPPHRALRIVYLNEIDNNPGPATVTIRKPGFLRLGAGTATTATNTADWTTPRQSLSIINIKVSSPNH